MKKIVIIGGGSGGVAAAIRASQLGADVTLVEAAHVGGVCMNRGCIPMRVLGSAAGVGDVINRGADFGLKAQRSELDRAKLKARLKDTVKYMRMGTQDLLASNGVRVVEGWGRLVATGAVQVGDESLPADTVILATGSDWKKPVIPGVDLKEVITSDELLETLAIPKRLVVLGGRPWAVELAAVWHHFGSEVTLAVSGQFLPEVDRAVSNRLRVLLKKGGLNILLQAEATAIKPLSAGVEVALKVKGKIETVHADRVLITDRAPRLEDSGLEAAGIEVTKGSITVNGYLQTSNTRVFALGDAIGEPLLSHKASAEGEIAAENAMGRMNGIDRMAIPRVVYTQPEVASVGLTEKEAEAQGHEVVVGEIPYGVNARAAAELASGGVVKIVCGSRYHEVLGVHIFGPQSGELITQAVLAIQLEATAEELARLVAPHPAFAESLVDAARMVLGRALYVPKQSG